MIFGLSSLKTLKLPISEMADGVSKELGSDSISFGDKTSKNGVQISNCDNSVLRESYAFKFHRKVN